MSERFRAKARAWFLYRAKPVTIAKAGPNPSNPDRRLVCGHCFPGIELQSGNWYAVQCPRCGRDAAEEMTPAEYCEVQSELDRAASLRVPLRFTPWAAAPPRKKTRARRAPPTN